MEREGEGRGQEGRGQEGKEEINISTNPPYIRLLGVIRNTRVNSLSSIVHTQRFSGESQKEQRIMKIKNKIKIKINKNKVKIWNGKVRVHMDIQR